MIQPVESFANHLKTTRSQKGLTQSELLEKLMTYDCSFHKLDLTTLSRWERGITTPNLAKQVLIIRCLDGNVSGLLRQNKEFNDNLKLNYSISRVIDPYCANKTSITAKTQPILACPESVKTTINGFHCDFLGIKNGNSVTDQKDLFITTYMDTSHTLLAHYIYGYAPESAIKSVKSDFFIPTHTRDKDENVILNIVSSYSSYSKPRHLIFKKIIKTIMNNSKIKGILLTVQYQEVFDFFSILSEPEVITKGKQTHFGGVKIHNKHYNHVQIYIKSEQIIASKHLANYLCKVKLA